MFTHKFNPLTPPVSPQFFIFLLLIFILLLAAGILGAVDESKVKQEVTLSSCHLSMHSALCWENQMSCWSLLFFVACFKGEQLGERTSEWFYAAVSPTTGCEGWPGETAAWGNTNTHTHTRLLKSLLGKLIRLAFISCRFTQTLSTDPNVHFPNWTHWPHLTGLVWNFPCVVVFSFQLKCCGLLNGPSDWEKIPDSCRCNSTIADCKSSAIYQEVRPEHECNWIMTRVQKFWFNPSSQKRSSGLATKTNDKLKEKPALRFTSTLYGGFYFHSSQQYGTSFTGFKERF